MLRLKKNQNKMVVMKIVMIKILKENMKERKMIDRRKRKYIEEMKEK